MHEVNIHVKQNRLYITLAGFFTDEAAKQASLQIADAMDGLETGFDVITDVSECRPVTPVGNAEIQRMQEYALSKGARQFIRVVGQRIITQMQFDRASKETGIMADCVATIPEAEQLLDHLN